MMTLLPTARRWTAVDWQSDSFGTGFLAELTSRMRSEDIPHILDRLGAGLRPLDGRTSVKRKSKEKAENPLDVLLATNMISVGVDVRRLGLMVVAGQPKATCRIYPGHQPSGPKSESAGPGLHSLQLGQAKGLVALRDVRALPRHVLQARRAVVGDAVLAGSVAARAGRTAGVPGAASQHGVQHE